MKKEDIKILEKEFDAIIEKFSNFQFVSQGFKNYSSTVKNTIYKSENLYRKRRDCQIVGCKEKSIKRSHSIPKSSILQCIASNGHLLTPEFDSSDDFPTIRMKKIGVNGASVFPGFCEKHENLFRSFEIDGQINTGKKAILQTFRTICRERVDREIKLEINKIAVNEYKKKINEEAEELIKEAMSKYSQFDTIENVAIDGIDLIQKAIKKLDCFLLQPMAKFDMFEKYIYCWLLNLHSDNELIVRVVNLDFHLPISICGFGNLDYLDNGKKKNACMLINVLPKKDSTDVVFVSLKNDNSYNVEEFLNLSLSSPINILNTLESFMVNGTDHWYINPDYWENIPKGKRDKILQDILFTDDSFLDQYNISIFDDIRLNLISTFKSNIKADGRKIMKHETQRIEHEIKKLNSKTYDIISDKEILTKKIFEIFNQIKS